MKKETRAEKVRRGLDEFHINVNRIDELRKISRQLHHLDERSCNYGLTEQQEKREKGLEKKANELVAEISPLYRAYHQSDPRGCSLYIITDEMGDTNYNNGMAIH